MPLQTLSLRSTASQPGFSLIELMVAISVMTILTLIAVPSYRDFVAAQRVKNSGSDIHIALLQTRSEAIKRNASATMAPVGGDWLAGWTITVGGVQVASHNPIANLAIDGPASVVYLPAGRITAAADSTFEVTSADTSTVRCIKISPSGRPSVKDAAC